MGVILRGLKAQIGKKRLSHYNDITLYFSSIIWPVIQLVSIAYIFKPFEQVNGQIGMNNTFLFIGIGYLAYNIFFLMMESAWTFSMEKNEAVLEAVFVTPYPRYLILLGNCLGTLFESIWISIIGFLIITLNFKIYSIETFMWGFVGFLLLLAISIAWGIFLSSLMLVLKDVSIVFNLCQDPVKIFGGVIIPVSLLPWWGKLLSLFFPLVYPINIIRNASLGNMQFILNDFYSGLFFLISFLLFSYKIYLVVDTRYSRNGYVI